MSAPVDSFQTRVKSAVNGMYHASMRRSIQSIALYEADRCLTDRYPTLRPFQRKYALLATAIDLLETLDFLNDYTRQEIMFRTNSSKEPLAPDMAWRRMKLITREVNQTILPKAKELLQDEDNRGKSHDDICEMLLQSMYEDSSDTNKPHPRMWEYVHNNVFSVYRVYYRGLTVDEDLFPAIPSRVVDVPVNKQDNFREAPINAASITGSDAAPTASMSNMSLSPGKRGKNNAEMSDEQRRAMLKEVKDHIELLESFKGVIPDEELNERKRALYAALPPVPTPAAAVKGGGDIRKQRQQQRRQQQQQQQQQQKRAKVTGADVSEEATKPAAMDEDWQNVGSKMHEDEATEHFTEV